MTWESLDWSALDRLRARFLSGTASTGPYWQSWSDLAAYDLTYAERIGWKWDAVLGELGRRKWRPAVSGRKLRAVDWGCGSGIASRRVISAWGSHRFERLLVADHSPLAQDFACEQARNRFPDLAVDTWDPRHTDEPIDLLIISHVLNELPSAALESLLRLVRNARAILWVEPGTYEVSRNLQRYRDDLSAQFRVIAPCTHTRPCALLSPENERHWCHHFAPAPSGVYADRDWVKFGQRAGIDLRSLPYAMLVLEHKDAPQLQERTADSVLNPDATLSRVIGRPEHFKPYARVLNCDEKGIHELEVMKRQTNALYKHLERTRGPLLYSWSHDGNQVIAGQPAYEVRAADAASESNPEQTSFPSS